MEDLDRIFTEAARRIHSGEVRLPSLRVFHLAARRNLQHRLAGEARRARRQYTWLVNTGVTASAVDPPFDDSAESSAVADRVLDMIRPHLLDTRMRTVFGLLRRGERWTEVFAEALGLAQLPPRERVRAVKREKDRLKKHLERNPSIQQLASDWYREIAG